MSSLPVYNSRRVAVNYFGVPIDGLAADSFVTFSRNADQTAVGVGADGKPAISMLPDKTGSCTISLQQQSLSNNALVAFVAGQDLSGELIRGALVVVDPAAGGLAVMSNAHIQTTPEFDFGSDASSATRDWTFFCEEMIFVPIPDGTNLSPQATAQLASIVGSAASLAGGSLGSALETIKDRISAIV